METGAEANDSNTLTTGTRKHGCPPHHPPVCLLSIPSCVRSKQSQVTCKAERLSCRSQEKWQMPPGSCSFFTAMLPAPGPVPGKTPVVTQQDTTVALPTARLFAHRMLLTEPASAPMGHAPREHTQCSTVAGFLQPWETPPVPNGESSLFPHQTSQTPTTCFKSSPYFSKPS